MEDHHIKNRKMKQQNNLYRLVLKIAKTHQFNRLPQSYSRCSPYTTPDHPPYHLMIERAIKELNENGGSSMESISQFLEKEYNCLALAHSTLLKYHLVKFCESGAIVLTQGSKYMLTKVNNTSRITKIGNRPTGIWGRGGYRHCINQRVENRYDQQQHNQIGVPSSFPNIMNGVPSSFKNRMHGEADLVKRRLVHPVTTPAMMVAQETCLSKITGSDIWAPRR